MTIVQFTKRAERDAERIDAWWREHRDKAPRLFTEELASAIAMIETMPDVGRSYAARRREHAPGADVVRVLTIWHARRGREPLLR